MYRTRQVRNKRRNRLRNYCRTVCMDSSRLYNRANYIIRQYDPAYRALPAQANQQVLKRLLRDYRSFFAALKVYGEHPERFTGRPKMPGYKKKGAGVTAVLTNQICRIRKGHFVRFPWTGEMLDIGDIPEGGRLKEVRIKPCHGDYCAEAVLEYDDSRACRRGKLTGMDEETLKRTLKESDPGDYRVASIDPGVDNFCAVVNNFGARPFLIRGGSIKSENRYYNRKLAR